MDASMTAFPQDSVGPDGHGHEGARPGNGIVKEAQRHKLLTAAIIGGAVAAGAGAFVGTRAIARRNAAKPERPLSSVMATAITACDLKQAQGKPRT